MQPPPPPQLLLRAKKGMTGPRRPKPPPGPPPNFLLQTEVRNRSRTPVRVAQPSHVLAPPLDASQHTQAPDWNRAMSADPTPEVVEAVDAVAAPSDQPVPKMYMITHAPATRLNLPPHLSIDQNGFIQFAEFWQALDGTEWFH